MTKVTLHRIKNNGQLSNEPLRTNEVTGVAFKMPEVGCGFRLVSDPINPDAQLRLLVTSPVVRVYEEAGLIRFDTANSTYELVVEKSV